MPQPVTGDRDVAVGRVRQVVEPANPGVLGDLHPPKREQRAHDAGGPSGRDTGEPSETTATQQSKKDGLGLIVGLMRRHQHVAAQFRSGLGEERVAKLASVGLVRWDPRRAADAAHDSAARAEVADPARVRVAPGPHSMVEVGGGDPPSPRWRQPQQQIEQNHRVEPSRKGDCNPDPRRKQVAGAQVGREPLGQPSVRRRRLWDGSRRVRPVGSQRRGPLGLRAQLGLSDACHVSKIRWKGGPVTCRATVAHCEGRRSPAARRGTPRLSAGLLVLRNWD